MNILDKIQEQMKAVEISDSVIRDITYEKDFLITFHNHYEPIRASVYKYDEKNASVMCLIDKGALVIMDDQSPSKELIDAVEYINSEASKL